MGEIPMDFYSRYNSWTVEFGYQVKVEYERFLELRAENDKLSPSDTIDKLWHIHILDTKSYISYCIKKFGRYIHHNPADSVDQVAREIRLVNTKASYSKKFGKFVYPEIWGEIKEETKFKSKPDIESTIARLQFGDLSIGKKEPGTKTKPAFTSPFGFTEPLTTVSSASDSRLNIPGLPDYRRISEQTLSNTINVLITCSPDLFSGEKIPMANKTIQIPLTNQTKFNDITKIISDKMGLKKLMELTYKSIAIRLTPHPEYVPKPKLPEKRVFGSSYGGLLSHNSLPSGDYFSYEDYDRVRLDTNVIVNSSTPDCKFYIADIHEMTQMGYC